MIDDGLRGVAYHEAGHAVVALALGCMSPASRFSTRTTPAAPTWETPIICLSRIRSQSVFPGMNANHMFKAPIHELAAFQDHYCVHNLVLDIAEPEGDVLPDKGHQRAWDLLGAHAGSVEDIAAQLLAPRST